MSGGIESRAVQGRCGPCEVAGMDLRQPGGGLRERRILALVEPIRGNIGLLQLVASGSMVSAAPQADRHVAVGAAMD
jgi:hypothetical protein